MSFNKNLQGLRKSKNLTQEQLAEILFVSRTAVSKWESGKGYPNIDTLKDVAEFFSVSVDELISDDLVASIAKSKKKNERYLSGAIFAITDLLFILFIFLPFYGVKGEDGVRSAGLAEYVCVSSYLKSVYYILLSGVSVLGAAEAFYLILKGNISRRMTTCSLIFHSCSIFSFALSGQPYVTAFLFAFLIIKIFILSLKREIH